MAKRYFGFNTLAGGSRSAAVIVDGDTTANTFDSAFVASSIKIPGAVNSNWMDTMPFIDGNATGTMWTVFELKSDSTLNTTGYLVQWLNSSGTPIVQLKVASSSAIKLQFWNGAAWVDVGGAATLQVTTSRQRIAVSITMGGAIAWYAGNVLVDSTATSNAAVNNVDKVRFSTSHGSGASFSYYSQIMGADYDIRDSHISSKLPSAEGTYATDGTGVYTDVNEAVLNDATAIQLPTSGQHRTFTKGAIPAVPVGLQIAGMVINARGRIGGAITDGKLLCKQGGSDTLSTGRTYGSAYEPRGAFFSTDPATSSAWSESGFNSAEAGFAAV